MGERIGKAKKLEKTCELKEREFNYSEGKRWDNRPLSDAKAIAVPPRSSLMPSESPDYFGKTVPRCLLLSMTLRGMQSFFGQFSSAVLALSPPNLLAIPSLLVGMSE